MKTLVVASLLALAPMAVLAGNGERPHGGPDMFKKMDTNADGVVTKDEAEAAGAAGMAKRFEVLDANKDGQLTQDEIQKAHESRRTAMKEKLEADFKAADKNGDGGLSKQEAAAMPRIAQHFDALDANKDGVITQAELQAHREQMRGKRHSPATSQS